MKRTILTVGAAFVLLPFFSAAARADHYAEWTSAEPTIVLRCRQRLSTERHSFEHRSSGNRSSENHSSENHSFSHHSFETEQTERYATHHDSFSEQHANSNAPIREILRRRETSRSGDRPVVIEVQGDCDAIRIGIGTEWDELFPGEFDHSIIYEDWDYENWDYENWDDTPRSRPGRPDGTLYPWRTRPGSGWDWLFRRSDSSLDNSVAKNAAEIGHSPHCVCISAPCPCAN
ncbi:MAG: hypothetical protein AB8B99_11335 [Phormidesmis sp.]